MKPEIILQADMLDILFENKNKAYGAYLLRKGYNGRLVRSLYGTVALVTVLLGLNFLVGGHRSGTVPSFINIPDQAIQPVDVEIKKEPEMPKPKPALKPPVATIQNTTLVIVKEEVRVPPPTITELDQPVAIGTATKDGAPAEGNAIPAPTPATGTGKAPVEAPAEENKIFITAENMPEYPGGIRALLRFLQKNLTVPEGSMEAGQQVRVPVRFVVNRDGELTDLAFPEPAANEFRKEILRVMHKMPKWKAGSQNGHPVAVYFTLPIIFATESE